jgi:hypothetical protein
MEGRWPLEEGAIRNFIIALLVQGSFSYPDASPHHPCKINVTGPFYVCIVFEIEINLKEWHIPTKRLNIKIAYELQFVTFA